MTWKPDDDSGEYYDGEEYFDGMYDEENDLGDGPRQGSFLATLLLLARYGLGVVILFALFRLLVR